MRIRLIAGRWLTDEDRQSSRAVAVVDDEMVRRYWPNQNPIGKRLGFGDPQAKDFSWIEVVGVVEHAAHEGLDAERRVQLYFSYRQRAIPFLSVAVRTAGDPLQMTNAVRAVVQSVDRDQPIANVRTMDDLMGTAVGQRRLSTWLLAIFAGIALLLAAIGIYGVMSFDVTRRTQELGLRMALGAARGSVLSLVVRQGMILAVAGLGIGFALAFVSSRLIESQLFGISSNDPTTWAGVIVVLGLVAFFATMLPALRATRVDPMEALRYE
jgi:predicted permease